MDQQQLAKKVKSYLENNFPEPDKYNILQLDINLTKIELYYGKDKITISIGLDTSSSSLFKLIETKFAT